MVFGRLHYVVSASVALMMLITAVSGSVLAPAGKTVPSTLSADLREQLDDLEAGTFIIRLTDTVTEDDLRWLQAAGVGPGLVPFTVIPAVAGHATVADILDIARDPRVAHISLNEEMEYHLDRSVQAVRADQTWSADYGLSGSTQTGGFDGSGVVVAVVDSGVDGTHPDLLHHTVAAQQNVDPKVIRNYKMESTVLEWNDGPLADYYEDNYAFVDLPYTEVTGGHGTHVSGIVGGTGAASDGRFKGGAPGTDLVVYGAGEGLSILEALSSFEHIHRHHEELGIRIVTNSWGTDADYDPDNPVVVALETLVVEDGLVVVFSAGNAAGDGSEDMTDRYGKSPHAIMVANYYDKDGWVDWSSSRGVRSDPATWPSVAAPGTQIISAVGLAAPISYVGTGLDVIHTVEDGKTEPWVVPAPVAPTTIEVADQEVMFGHYGSFTGTSMSAPMVTAVAALMLEANPALTPPEVQAILEGTANMPEGRSYEADGFAIGHGVVDATQAVAAALRMAEGASLHEAIHQAYADTSASPAQVNLDIQNNLRVEAPDSSGSTLGVTVDLDQGPLNDDSIPLAPVGVVTPDIEGSPHIYQGGVIDPFLAGGHAVLPGEPVGLAVRGMSSSAEGLDLTDYADLDARFIISQGGTPAYGPLAAEVSADSGVGGQQMSADWTVPLTAEPGSYVLEATITVISSGQTYTAPSLEFMIAGPPDSQSVSLGKAPGDISTPQWAAETWNKLLGDSARSETLLQDDFEGGHDGWAFRQQGQAEGFLTNWAYVASGVSWTGANSGSAYFNVGLRSTELPAPVAQFAYTNTADTTLVSPELDLTDAVDGQLEYHLAGASEKDFDFLTVSAVARDGTATELARYSGENWIPFLTSGAPAWSKETIDLSPALGEKVRLEFRFTSDEIWASPTFGGWNVDDVTVTATIVDGGGGGGGVDPVIAPAISASPDHGIGTLDTTLTFDAVTNVAIASWDVDPGDGSGVQTFTEAGDLAHSYTTPGQYLATVTAHHNSTTNASTSVLVDVAPTGIIQVRVGDGLWVDAGPDTGADVSYNVDLDISGLAPGDHPVETRLFDGAGGVLRDLHVWERL